MKSLLPDNWRKLRGMLPRQMRFVVYLSYIGEWEVVDDAYGFILRGFETKREATEFKSFCNAYVKRWGDIDFNSVPYKLSQPLHYDEPKMIREWWHENEKWKQQPLSFILSADSTRPPCSR